jgi:ceramide glucosyltransferase
MNEAIIISLSIAISISILHLLTSVIIMNQKIKVGLSQNEISKTNNYPSISILKPLKGIDDSLEDNLRSFFNLDYPDYEIIFGLDSYRDPAMPIVRKLQTEFTNVKSKLIVNNYAIGLNPKVNNMNNMYPATSGEYIFINDSNTRVKKNFLKKLIAEFEDKNIGLVTATIRGVGAKNTTSIWENFHLNTFVAPNVFIAKKFADISIVIGKSILLPRKVLNEVGGFDALKNYLAEDHLLGLKVREHGYEIKTSLTMVDNVNENISFSRFINRHSRWAKMRRNIDLKHYLLEWFSNPIFSSLLLFGYLHNLDGVIIFSSLTIIKMSHDFFVMNLMKSDFKWYHIFEVPIKDLTIAIIWFAPFFSHSVKWRNNKIKIGRNSVLQSA